MVEKEMDMRQPDTRNVGYWGESESLDSVIGTGMEEGVILQEQTLEGKNSNQE